jgi:tRNA modification GTPase
MNGKATIYALSSGAGRAGIAVVRLSGTATAGVLRALAGEVPPPRKAQLKTIRSRNGLDVIDKGLVLFFPAPFTVTGEDVGEFHIHGSVAIVERLLTELSAFRNCRTAEPGEFTRRAFESERMDLVEVEGLADLLAAQTESQRKLAMRQFSGEASNVYLRWHSDLTGALAIIEASIDFADEDGVAARALASVRPRLAAFRAVLIEALAQSARASVVRSGLRIVIAGAPNVGKSSLMNVLAQRRAAIVSDIPGTTRDVVEAPLVINGVSVVIADTAGLRGFTQDAIEREGMARSLSEMHGADILIWVRDATSQGSLPPERTPHLTIINKADLAPANSIHSRNESEMLVSVKSGLGMAALQDRLAALVAAETSTSESAVMVRVRHQESIAQSIRFLNDALAKPDDALELMAEDVRKAAQAMASITGRVGVEDLLGRIFSEFCIGK